MIMALFFTVSAFADKAGVSIQAPPSAKKGETITLTVKVTHNGNNILHYVDYVTLTVNGQEVKQWEYSAFDRAENEDFSVTHELEVTETMNIEAKANCNIHGSKGVKTHTIKAN
jgi:desulfoferrodoxin (superoxide reductase-like protein)